MRDFVMTFWIVLALGLAEAALGPRSTPLRAFLTGLAVLTAFAGSVAGVPWRAPRNLVFLGAGLTAWALGSALGPPVSYFAFALAFAAAAALDTGPERRTLAASLALTLFTFAAFVVLRDSMTLWPRLLAASARVSTTAAQIVGARADLGPTYFGVWTGIAVVLACTARAAVTGSLRWGAAAGTLVLLVLAPLAWLGLGQLPLSPHSAITTLLRSRACLFVLQTLPLSVFLVAHPALSRRADVTSRSRIALAVAVAVTGLVLLTFAYPTPARSARVLLDTRGAFNLQPLEWGKYGSEASQGASLGTLPRFLAARGFDLTQHDTTLDAATLAQHDVLMLMNPTQPFDAVEHQAVWDFVRAGGGLLVLGDHTNIQEILAPLDSILSPCGIRVAFDSAIPIAERWTWYNSIRVHPHPLTRGLRGEDDLKISVGASLHLSSGALPLLTGRDAYSDPGNWENRAGAYLGNMRYDRGEPLGDLPIVAGRDFGRGRVVVFGDTSPFQRTSVYNTHEFLTRVFTYLAHGGRSVAPLVMRLAGALLLVTGCIRIAASLPATPVALALAAFLAGAWLTLSARIATVALPDEPWRGDIAWIDLAHGNRVDVHAGRDDGINGFADHLWRQGYVPLGMKRVDLEGLAQARVFATVAPAFEFSRPERRALRQFVENGGLLIVASGFEERSGSTSLLGDFGYAIGRTPIGSAHQAVCHLEGEFALMHESWPVQRPEGRGEVWVESWGYPVIVFERIGAGGLIVIGDSRFLCDVKLESADTFVEPNIDFLRHAMETARFGAPAVKP